MLRHHRIRWSECDQYAHANNASYLLLCEDLRVAHWRALGGQFALGEPGPVVSRIEARYLKPLEFDDAVALTLKPGVVRRSSFTHDYAVWKQGLVFTCTAVLVLIRHGSGEKCAIPPTIRAQLLDQGGVDEAGVGEGAAHYRP